MVDPTRFPRRTPLRRSLPDTTKWSSLGDAAVPERIDDATALGAIAFADLSPLPRLGFKGRGTIDAMKARGLNLRAEPNQIFRQADGGLCLVLGAGEVLLLDALDGDGARLAELERAWRIEDEERTYPVPRRDSHCWFALAGEAVPAMFAKLCAVDLRLHRFADCAIAQTTVARLSAIVARADRDGMPVFHLLADSAAAVYLWTCLIDASQEFGGSPVGLEWFRIAKG